MAEQLFDVIEVDPDGGELADVIALGRRNKRTLGLMPDEGFADRAAKGTLLAARIGGQVVGYALYDLPNDKVKLGHLCVDGAKRGSGVARRLIDELSARHQQRRGVELACRRDYEVNQMWPKLGFSPLHERPGRSRAQLPLNLWWRDHGHPDLFSEVAAGQEMAVVDHMIVIDSATGFVQEGKHSQALFDDWVAEFVSLYVAPEAYVEIDRHADPKVRKATRDAAHSLRQLRLPSGNWKALVKTASVTAPAAGASDHIHLAQAAAAGAQYLITRDGRLLRAAEEVAAAMQIEVLRPEALVRKLDRLRAGDRYEPRLVEATNIESRSGGEVGEEDLVRAFLNYAQGEKKKDFVEVLRTLFADPQHHEVLVFADGDGRLLGLVGRTVRERRLEVALLRVGPGDPLREVVARQLVFQQRQEAANRRCQTVAMIDGFPSASVERVLSTEGFVPESQAWVCRVERGIRHATPEEQADGPRWAAALERQRWPLKLEGAGIPTYLVPIKLGWAERLFETRLAEQTLLPRERVLGLSREHVYYRSVANHRDICPGARVLWYVTGTGPGQNQSHIRAVSQVVEVVTGRPRTLHRRFARLGVYSETEVAKTAGSKQEIMAIRFVDTELLAEPLSFSTLKELFEQAGERFVQPFSPQRLREHMFCPMYERASAYAD